MLYFREKVRSVLLLNEFITPIPPSKTMVMYPVVAALVKAEEFLGTPCTWQAINDQQRRFLTDIFALCRAEGTKIPEIESIASWNVEEVNAFLVQRGFSIQLKPLGSHSFAIASALELLVEWVQGGSERQLQDHTKKSYPAVRPTTGVTYYRSDTHSHPIAALETKTRDIVYLTMYDQAPDDFDLLARVEQLANSFRPVDEFGGVIFPMVDLRQEVDITWLIGMKTTPRGDTIGQALQETMLQMNERGALARSAVAIEIRAGSTRVPQSRPDMVINRPFLIWFARQGLSKPLFVGYITQENWKKPGRIS